MKIKYLILPLFIFILIIASGYCYNYLNKETTALEREIQKINQEIFKYKRKIELVNDYKKLRDSITFKIKIYKNGLEAKSYLVDRIINDIKQFKGLLTDYKFKNTQQNSSRNNTSDINSTKKYSFESLNITINAEFKSYKNFINFIKLLESDNYLFLIKKIKIIKKGIKLETTIISDYEFQVG